MEKNLATERKEQMQPMEPGIMEHRGNSTDPTQHSCALCGQLYHSFAFKGGYICEDCLQSIKYPEKASDPPAKKA